MVWVFYSLPCFGCFLDFVVGVIHKIVRVYVEIGTFVMNTARFPAHGYLSSDTDPPMYCYRKTPPGENRNLFAALTFTVRTYGSFQTGLRNKVWVKVRSVEFELFLT